jgi:mRNA interferase HigB
MVTISKGPLNEFGLKHASAAEPLNTWYHIVKLADWKDFNALREDMPDTDYIGNDRFIFNVKSYRILVMIFFDVRTIYVRRVMTHAEYDKLQPRLPTL